MLNWNIVILIAEHDNTDERKVWAYINELQIRYTKLSSNIVFNFLVDAPSGVYYIYWGADKFYIEQLYKTGKRITCNGRKLINFIRYARTTFPAKNYCFVYSGGGFGIYLNNDETCYISITQLVNVLKQGSTRDTMNYSLSYPWQLIIFDCCLMATLETLVEVAPITPFFIGCEMYEPDLGAFSMEMVNAFENYQNVPKIGQAIIDSFIKRVNSAGNKFDPADMVLLDTRYANQLAYMVKHSHVKLRDFFKINESYFYDLYSAIKNHKVRKLIKAIVLYYQQSRRLIHIKGKEKFHGLSFCAYTNGKYENKIYSMLQINKI